MTSNNNMIENKETNGTNGSGIILKPQPCDACNTIDDVRIIERQCGHVVCIPCILSHLKHRIIIDGSSPIKCLIVTCNSMIHDNDINAVLDDKESALEPYMPVEHRRYLQHKHNKHSIMQALPTVDFKRCPICKAIYTVEPGCIYVICANSACNTPFCWRCEKVIGRPETHYTTASSCRLGYTDYATLLNVVTMILDINVIILWILFPFVYLLAFIYIPIAMLFIVPISMAYHGYKQSTQYLDVMMTQDMLIALGKTLMGFGIGCALSVPMAITSLPSGFIITGAYMIFCCLKMLPCGLSGDLVGRLLCIIRWVGRLFKIGPYGELLREAQKDRLAAEAKLEESEESKPEGATNMESAAAGTTTVATGASTGPGTSAVSTNDTTKK